MCNFRCECGNGCGCGCSCSDTPCYTNDERTTTRAFSTRAKVTLQVFVSLFWTFCFDWTLQIFYYYGESIYLQTTQNCTCSICQHLLQQKGNRSTVVAPVYPPSANLQHACILGRAIHLAYTAQPAPFSRGLCYLPFFFFALSTLSFLLIFIISLRTCVCRGICSRDSCRAIRRWFNGFRTHHAPPGGDTNAIRPLVFYTFISLPMLPKKIISMNTTKISAC